MRRGGSVWVSWDGVSCQNLLLKGECAIVAMENAVVLRRESEDAVEMVTIGVGNEGLSEGVATDEGYDALYPVCIKTVKDVIEQQDGAGA